MDLGEFLLGKKSSGVYDPIRKDYAHFGTGLTVNGNMRHVQGTLASANFVTGTAGYSLNAADGSIEVQNVKSVGGLNGAIISGGELTIGQHFYVTPTSSSGSDVVLGVGEDASISKTQGTSSAYTLGSYSAYTAASGSGGSPFKITRDGALTTTGITMDSVSLTTIQTASESFADNDTSLMTSAAVLDKIQSEMAYTWTDYTPSCSWPVTINQASYIQMGKIVFYKIQLTLTGTPSTSTFELEQPVVEVAGQSVSGTMGTAYLREAITGSDETYIGTVYMSGDDFRIAIFDEPQGTTSNWNEGLTKTRIFTWGSGDEIRMSGFYEVD